MENSLRIVMVAACPFPFPRGTPIRIHRMAGALAQRGHDVHVVTYHIGDRVEAPGYTIHRIARVPTYRRTSPGPSYQKLLVLDPLLRLKLGQVLRGSRFDLIHAHHFEGFLASFPGAYGGRSMPLLFDVHTLLQTELPYYGLGLPKWVKRLVGRLVDRHAARRATGIIAVTEEIRTILIVEHGIEPERIAVVSNGVESELFAGDDGRSGEAGGQQKSLVYAGNLAPYQGVELMLEALAYVIRQRPDVRLTLLTDDDFSPFDDLAQRLGVRAHIDVLTTTFAELPAQLERAGIALNPRVDCDGIPVKLLNYMAAGKPVVSFAGSAKHGVHGKHAWVVADRDVAAFAEAILQLLRDAALARRLGDAARRYVQAEHGWDRVAERIEEIYRAALNRRMIGTFSAE